MTLYRTIVNIAHHFRALSFRTGHAVRNILTTKISRFTVLNVATPVGAVSKTQVCLIVLET